MARGTDKDDAFYFPDEQLYVVFFEKESGRVNPITLGYPYRVTEGDAYYIFTSDAGDAWRLPKSSDMCSPEWDSLSGMKWHIVKKAALCPEQCRMAGIPVEDATIAELRERIEALEARVQVEEKAEPEWPQKGDHYWYIDATGEVVCNWWGGGTTDIDTRTFMGIYPNRQIAEKRARQIQIVVEELNSGRSVKIRDGEDALVP